MLIEWSREVGVSVWNFYQLYFSLYCCFAVFSIFYGLIIDMLSNLYKWAFLRYFDLSIRFVSPVLFLFPSQFVMLESMYVW